MKFVSLELSPYEGKRFMIVFEDPDITLHFGSDVGRTFIDHKDKRIRQAYIKRHAVREDWTKVNPGSLSRFLLWGDSTDIETNLNNYLTRFNIN